MINTILGTAISIIMLLMINSNNPMKMSFAILFTSSMLFLMVKTSTGSTWMTLVFFILFTGGILMAFMILASILPNEKMLKIKSTKSMFLLLILIALMNLLQLKGMELGQMSNQMKAFMSSSLTLMFMVSMILTYFFGSVNLNTTENSSMRSIMC